jgi:hypothetical protein
MFQDSQGFTDARPSTEKAHSGQASLRITADLIGQHPNKANGEVYLDLRNHAPVDPSNPCRRVAVPMNLRGMKINCWIWLPRGSAGPADARNGVQLFCKSVGFHSLYGPWMNILPDWEEKWVQIEMTVSNSADSPLFDPTNVIALGFKAAINSASNATISGPIYLDDYALETNPKITFDFERLEVERDFADLRSVLDRWCSERAARVFVFANGAAAPSFAPNGEVIGLDENFFQDFDALLNAARQSNIFLMPVLLDFYWCDTLKIESGVQVGGRSEIIRDQNKRQTFLDRALGPLIERYRNEPRIIAWDLINEPEWAMQEVPKDFQVGDPVLVSQMQDFVRQCAEVIHSRSLHPVTVGSARRKWLGYWRGLGLDFYQFHWYDKFEAEEPFPWLPYHELRLDRPCIIGEVPTASTRYSVSQFLEAAYDGGYHGLLVWSYRASDDFSDFCRAAPQLNQWCATRRIPRFRRLQLRR